MPPEKSPEERFQAARDVAFDLEMLSSASSTTAAPRVAEAKVRRPTALVVAIVAALVLVASGILIDRVTRPIPSSPDYQQVTFRRGTVLSGKFGTGGQVLYSAAWDGSEPEIFSVGEDMLQLYAPSLCLTGQNAPSN